MGYFRPGFSSFEQFQREGLDAPTLDNEAFELLEAIDEIENFDRPPKRARGRMRVWDEAA